MPEKRIVESLIYKFTRRELEEIAEALARATHNVREIETRKQTMAATIAAELKQADAIRFELADKYRDKYEYRDVDCVAQYGTPRAGLKTILRCDTGEELRTEAMTADEMQQNLDFGSGAETKQ